MLKISKKINWLISLIFILLISNVSYAQSRGCSSGDVERDISGGDQVTSAILCPGASMRVLLPRHTSFGNIIVTFFVSEPLTRNLQTSSTISNDITGSLANFVSGNNKLFSVDLKNSTSERVAFSGDRYDRSLFNTGAQGEITLTNVNDINVELFLRVIPTK